MNAVVMAYGLAVGGRNGGRRALRTFWESVSHRAPFSVVPDVLEGPRGLAIKSALPAGVKPLLSLTRYFSPSQLNAFYINPLRDLLIQQVGFDLLRTKSRPHLFIATTQVSTGTPKVFRNKQLTIDVLLASACLPLLHRAVEMNGETYWDGGLTSSPPLFPLVHKCAARDMMVMVLQPEPRLKVPKTADEIWHCLTEIGFSSTFFTEVQGLMLA